MQGDVQSQAILAWMYDHDSGVTYNPEKAAHWYEKAAMDGNSNAQVNIGWKYENGDGVEKHFGKAFHWYKKAADQDEITAQFNIGQFYNHGRSVPMDNQDYSYFRSHRNRFVACKFIQKLFLIFAPITKNNDVFAKSTV